MNNNELELTILMPCLNEERTIEASVNEAKKYIFENNLKAEILVADNGSSDNSKKIALACGAKVINVEKKGYGNALRGGIMAAKGKYVIMGDCDNSYDFYHIDEFVKYLREGYDLVMGNRFRGGVEKGAMPFSHRVFGVPFLSWAGRKKYHVDIGDFHCGLRGFNREAAMKLELKCEGMEFATEIIGKFAKSNGKIIEIPVVLRKDGRSGKSHLRSVSDGIRHLKYIVFS